MAVLSTARRVVWAEVAGECLAPNPRMKKAENRDLVGPVAIRLARFSGV
jgi:hypothetical protein